MSDLTEMVYAELKAQLADMQKEIDANRRVEQALYSDSLPAYTVANLPTLANGGLGNGVSYITLAFASNGLKGGEISPNGTGVLVYYNAPTNQWLKVYDNLVVSA